MFFNFRRHWSRLRLMGLTIQFRFSGAEFIFKLWTIFSVFSSCLIRLIAQSFGDRVFCSVFSCQPWPHLDHRRHRALKCQKSATNGRNFRLSSLASTYCPSYQSLNTMRKFNKEKISIRTVNFYLGSERKVGT